MSLQTNNFNKEQLEFLQELDYLTGYEIKDLLGGFTSLDVLLDPYDLELFENIPCEEDIN